MERDYGSFDVESNKPQPVEEVATEPVTVEADVIEPTTTDDPKEEVNEAPKPQGKSRAQKRIEALIQEKHDLARQLEEAKASKPDPKLKELDPDDFEDYDDYLSAVEEKKPKEVTKEVSKTDDNVAVVELFKGITEDMIDKYEDYEDKLSDMPLLTIDMIRVLNESDEAGEVAYYLANNPKEAKALSQLSLGKMAIEVGKIELKLSQPKAVVPITKKVTSAPEPVTPVGGSNMPPRSLSEATSQSEYEAMRKSQSQKSNGFI